MESNPGPINFALPGRRAQIREKLKNWDGSAAGVCVHFAFWSNMIPSSSKEGGLHVIRFRVRPVYREKKFLAGWGLKRFLVNRKRLKLVTVLVRVVCGIFLCPAKVFSNRLNYFQNIFDCGFGGRTVSI